ncbi:MAG: hypothetical protein FWF59_13390 [Turicibacter sp.]|nr:hypothetical protein [Turicibacter sp.]
METKKNPLALAAFIVGVVAVFVPIIGIIPGIVAVVLGIIALRSGTLEKNDKVFAIVGTVTGGIAVLLLPLLAVSFFTIDSGVSTASLVSVDNVSDLLEYYEEGSEVMVVESID